MSRIRPKVPGKGHGGFPKEPGRISWSSLFARYRWWAKQKKFAFSISLEEFIQVSSKPCHYCGLPPQEHNYYRSQPKSAKKTSKETRDRATIYKMGLDRINNKLGYTLKNITPCCRQCNWAKGTLTQRQFYSWINRFIKGVI